jgi:hypothetical protein
VPTPWAQGCVLRTPTEGRLCEAWSPEEYGYPSSSFKYHIRIYVIWYTMQKK